jgi:hypothetical protein
LPLLSLDRMKLAQRIELKRLQIRLLLLLRAFVALRPGHGELFVAAGAAYLSARRPGPGSQVS